MSLTLARAEIATAASTVDDVNVTPYFRQVTKAGQGFVKLERVEYPNKFGGVATLSVFVILPDGLAAAERRAEELEPLLYNALRPAWVLDSAQLADLQTDTGSLPVLQFTGHREY